ncbi:MAG: hypothetical protein M0R03_02245 [Novosphingobium sp.]|nr:hypothetical protein [Novosphingobium sp.]
MSRLMGIAAALAASLGIASGLAAGMPDAPRASGVQPAMIGADEPVHLGRVVVTATALPDTSDWI